MQVIEPQALKQRLDEIDTTLKAAPDQHLEFEAHRELIADILQLKAEKNALVLGHNYMHPLIFQVSEQGERGDSLALSRFAAESDQPIIVFNGVRFMAETAKILNPSKKVLIADLDAGCSLADDFTADDVKAYRARYPGAPVVTYINSYADVKAETDICCTSANAPNVIRHAAQAYNSDTVIFLPDSLMGRNLDEELRREGSPIKLIYPGKEDDRYQRCEVHEQFTADQLRMIREQYDMPKGAGDRAVLVHWECPPEVLAEADFYGSTSQMARYIAEHAELKRVYLATECEMAANLASEFPAVEFVKSCSVYCQHMRKISLEKLKTCLEQEIYEVHVDAAVAERARASINRMLAIKE